MDERDLAYLAGAIDADGWISIASTSGKRKRTQLRVAIEQCETEAVELAQAVFGGSISRRIHWTKKWRPSFHWEMTGAGAERVLTALLPYLRIKKRQAEYGLRFRTVVGDGRGRQYRTLGQIGGGQPSKRLSDLQEAFFRGMKGLIALRKAV